jgi:KGK domain
MKEHSIFSEFDDQDVISFLNGSEIKKVIDVRDTFQSSISHGQTQAGLKSDIKNNLRLSSNRWLSDGVDCEVLRLGSTQWQKGKIRVRIIAEFCPDITELSESSLDNFRQEITNNENYEL